MPFSGYTIFQAKEVGALLIDMNGGEVQLWKEFHGMPNRILPGGYLIGNTMITKSSGGRIFEATPEHEIVWEYISPCWGQKMKINMIYRAYRALPSEGKPKTPSRPVNRSIGIRSRIGGAVFPVNRSSIDPRVGGIIASGVARGNRIPVRMAVYVDIFPMVIRSIRIAAVPILTVGESGACRQKQGQSYHHDHQGF